MKIVTITIFFLCCALSMSAQQAIQDDLGINNPNLQAQKGSYDVLIDTTQGFHIVDMTPEVLRRIEANRALFTYSYIHIAPSIKVRIHPKNKVQPIDSINTVRDEQ